MSELSNRLEKLSGLTLTSVHMGIEEKTYETGSIHAKGSYLQDNWNVTISYNGKSYSTKYFSGIGHRKLIRSAKKEGKGYYDNLFGGFKTEMEACKSQWLKVVEPTLADVMCCLLSDSQCCSGTFEDFCNELGYNSDSIKALNTYLACQATRNGMIKVFGAELLDELSQLEH